RLKGLVHQLQRLAGPGGFWPAPADRNDRWLVAGVVNCLRNGIDKALVGIWREVDDDMCAWGHRAHNLNIKRDFAIGSLGIRRRVLAAIYPHGSHFGHSDAKLPEVLLQVAAPIAPT